MDNDQFAATLSYFQCVLLARRQQIDIGSLRLRWIDFDILNMLLMHGSLQPSLLSQLLSVSRSTISKRLSYLQKHELVALKKSSTDKRTHTLSLTSNGKELMNAVFKSHHDIATQARQVLSKDEQIQFAFLAQKLASHLDDASLRMI